MRDATFAAVFGIPSIALILSVIYTAWTVAGLVLGGVGQVFIAILVIGVAIPSVAGVVAFWGDVVLEIDRATN